MENVGLTFMMGMANAIGEGIGGMPSNTNYASLGGSVKTQY
jgi:hypothetical protein